MRIERIRFPAILVLTLSAAFSGALAEITSDKDLELRAEMLNVSKQLGCRALSQSELIFTYARENGIPREAVIRTALSIAEEACAKFEAHGYKKEVVIEKLRCNSMLVFLGNSGDLSVLPFLEGKSKSTNDYIRIDASLAYIRLSGVNAAPFLLRAAAAKRHSEMDRYQMYRSFGDQISAAKGKDSKVKLDDAYQCLVRLVETEEMGGPAELLDKVLCDVLEGYATSVQRDKVARRFSISINEYYKNHFNKVKEEIEKVPSVNRANLEFNKDSDESREKPIPAQGGCDLIL